MATGSASTSFVYDGTGLRQSETAGSATTYFTWDTEGALPLLLSDGANSYIYGPAGTPVEQVSSSGTPTYLLADQLGSTRALTNSSGSVTATFSYDAWGNLTGSTGSATTPFMYAGQYYDSATGLYYMQARYYDPASGQFLSLDPDVGLTRAPYNYAGDDPVNEVDPTGLSWIYILINESKGLPYYVGQTNVSVNSRLLAHTQSGRYNRADDTFEEFDLGDVSSTVTNQVEQATMSTLGTVQQGAAGYNQQNVFRAGTSNITNAQQEGIAQIEKSPRLSQYLDSAVKDIVDNKAITSRAIADQRFDVEMFDVGTPFGDEAGIGGGEEENNFLTSWELGPLGGCDVS